MSGVGTGTALLIGGLAGAGGGIASGIIGSSAAKSAASQQAQAADQSAQLQYLASQNALDFAKQQYATSQQQMQPWLQSGQAGLSQLDYMMGLSPYGAGVQAPGGIQQAPTVPTGTPAAPAAPAVPISRTGSVAPGMRPTPGAVASSGAVRAGGIPAGLTGLGAAPGGVVPSAGAGQGATTNPIQFGGMQQFNPATGTAGAVPTPTAGGRQPVTMPTGGPIQAGGLQGFDPSTGYAGPVQQPPAATGAGTGASAFGSLMQPFTEQFKAPTGLTEMNDPGYQARLQLGTDAIQRSAAARGNVLTGGTAKALNSYAQDYASNEYGNVYNRAFNEYANRYNVYNQNQANQFNRLASLAGVGQTAAGQLGTLGQNTSQQISNNLLNTAQGMGQAYQNAAAANASGVVGAANAWSGALGGAGSSINNLLMMQQLFGNKGGTGNTGMGASDYYGQWA